MEHLIAQRDERNPEAATFALCASLQLLDFATTALFLARGVGEANPLVRAAIEAFSNPLFGLALAKVFGLMLVVACWKLGKSRILKKINTAYAALIVWNVVALVLAAGGATT